MADTAQLMMQADPARLAAGPNPAAGGVGPGLTAAGPAASGEFSGLLQARLAPSSTPTPDTRLRLDRAGQGSPRSGAVSPLDGKALPGQWDPALPDEGQGLSSQAQPATGMSGLAIMAMIYGDTPGTESSEGELNTAMLVEDGTVNDTVLAQPTQLPEAIRAQLTRLEGATGLATGQGGGLSGNPAPASAVAVALNTAAVSGSSTVMNEAVPDTSSSTSTTSPLNRPLSGLERMALEQAQAALNLRQGQVTADPNSGLTRHLLAAGLQGVVGSGDGTATPLTLPGQHGQGRVEPSPIQPLASVTTESPDLSATGLTQQQRTPGMNSLPAMTVATPVGQQGWSAELGQRVSWMANNDIREAQIQLHPRHLGPVDVKISMGADQQMNVTFTATHPVTRDALDAAMPRLRDMFEQQGMQLGDAQVSQESFTERQNPSEQDANAGDSAPHQSTDATPALMSGDEDTPADGATREIASGLLDAYA